jgi:hypothetical protein
MSPSYIILPDPAPHPLWPFFPQRSFIVFSPPRRKLRARRTPVHVKRARATAYSALLAADGYSEAARDALRAGDDDAVRHCLTVLRAIVAVAIGQLHGSPSEHWVH